MLFVVVVEMLFPSSEIKKYLKLVLGFIVIYVVLSPLVDLANRTKLSPEANLWEQISYYQSNFGQDTSYITYEGEVEKQQEGMRTIYEEQLAESARRIIEKNVDVEVVTIEVQTYSEAGMYEVSRVELEVAYHYPVQETFGIGIGAKDESIVLSTEVLEKQIKNCLNNFYNWDNSNIYITVQEN